MKDLIAFEQEIGGDGAKAKGSLGVDADQLKLQLAVSYPIAKVIEPATSALDGLLEKVKALIPGDWDNVMIDKFKDEYKKELVKLLSE